jgi:glycosyltransferase involved in cell wall biosynthesis
VAFSYQIVVPVYNGAAYIPTFLQRFPPQLRKHLLFVDDGSTDDSVGVITDLGLPVIRHDENRGKGAAVLSGIQQAMGNGKDYIIVLDVDLQHPPEKIPDFILTDILEIRLGYRHVRKGMPLHRKMSNFLTSVLLTVRTNTIIKDSQCGFRSIPTRLFKEARFSEKGFQFESELLIKSALLRYRIVHVEIPTIYPDSISYMRPVKDTIKFVLLWFRSYFWT